MTPSSRSTIRQASKERRHGGFSGKVASSQAGGAPRRTHISEPYAPTMRGSLRRKLVGNIIGSFFAVKKNEKNKIQHPDRMEYYVRPNGTS